jgi:DNA repair exonuclease SbcCD ATPase subunit
MEVREQAAPQPVDLDELDQLHEAAKPGEWSVEVEEYGASGCVAIPEINRNLHDTEWADPLDFERDQSNADAIAALHNAYPSIAAEIRELRGKVEVLEAEAKQHDYDLTQTINERDEMEERVNSIAVALLLPEAEQEWTSANDVGERCVEAAEALRGRAYKLYKGLRDVVCAVGGVAEAGVSDEFLLNAAGEVRALREERDTLFADAAQWQAKAALLTSERDTLRAKDERLQEAQKENDQLRSLLSTSKADCAYCGLPANRMAECASGFPGCARADDMLCSATPTRDDLLDELTEARAEAARLREALEPFAARVKQYPPWMWTAMVEREKQGVVSGGFRVGGEEITHMPAMLLVDAESALTSTPITAEWLAARDAEQRRIGAAEELEKVRTGWLTSNEYRPGIPEIWRYIADRAARLRAGKGEG